MASLLCEMDHGAHEARTASNKRLPKAKLAIFLAAYDSLVEAWE
jgi:hypothetical protein